ncbi:alpha/beta hydrolase [Kosakonia sp. BK9b]|uniref:alpha/beta hydrolase n=1 Tax=Kosakonia sp. TaxID=1916651 RepID=UPI00289CBA5C|nr:alpha/beta hydrolase [Kosakonia sp.]
MQVKKTTSRFNGLRLLALSGLLLSSTTAYARPDMTPLGPNIADRGSAFYHFSVRTFDSADGQRHYKVWTGVPGNTPPAAGYPVVYMLDGNAVMDKLSDNVLQKLSQGNAPVLVAVGYQTPLPFDLNARAWDYTPAAGGKAQNLRGRTGGGSVVFRQLLEQTIAPAVEKDLPVDSQKRALWGHSYGGLFVLDSYLSSAFFTAYYSAVPSLGRNNFALLHAVEHVTRQNTRTKSLWFMEGDGEQRSREEDKVPDVLKAVRETASALRAGGAPVTYWLFPGLTHGAMFARSFEAALLDVAGNGQDEKPARIR